MTKQYVLAVSGGVDSVCLLDMYAKKHGTACVVAHVDHGIREDSAHDARFVQALAYAYGLEYVSKRYELGAQASEQSAREARYAFLLREAQKRGAVLVTAHHRDDVVGSVAINCLRGTGWRGLAVHARAGVERPLVAHTKQELYDYACRHKLEWVEDSTNASDAYLRNRLRGQVLKLGDEHAKKVLQLRSAQLELSQEIADEVCAVLTKARGDRHFYTMIDDRTAIELLRHEIAEHHGVKPRIDHAVRALLAIKTARPNTAHDVGGGVTLRFSGQNFVVETPL